MQTRLGPFVGARPPFDGSCCHTLTIGRSRVRQHRAPQRPAAAAARAERDVGARSNTLLTLSAALRPFHC